MSYENWQEFIANNLGKIIGVSLGLLFGWMIIQYGLAKTLFVIILVGIGYYFGREADQGGSLSSFVDRIFKR